MFPETVTSESKYSVLVLAKMALARASCCKRGGMLSFGRSARLLSCSAPRSGLPKSYDIRRQDWDEFSRLTNEKIQLRFEVSRCNIYLCANPGSDVRSEPWNTVTHIWEFDDLVQRAAVRKQLGGDENWLSQYLRPALKMMGHQANSIMQLAPNCSLQSSPPSHRHFAVRKTQLHPGMTAAWLKTLGEMPAMENQPLGTWTTDIGDLDSVIQLYSYADRQSLMQHQQSLDSATAPFQPDLVKSRQWNDYEIASWSPEWSV